MNAPAPVLAKDPASAPGDGLSFLAPPTRAVAEALRLVGSGERVGLVMAYRDSGRLLVQASSADRRPSPLERTLAARWAPEAVAAFAPLTVDLLELDLEPTAAAPRGAASRPDADVGTLLARCVSILVDDVRRAGFDRHGGTFRVRFPNVLGPDGSPSVEGHFWGPGDVFSSVRTLSDDLTSTWRCDRMAGWRRGLRSMTLHFRCEISHIERLRATRRGA